MFSALLVSAVFFIMPFFITVGKITGAENESAEIFSGKYKGEYILSACNHSIKDKGVIIGRMDGNITRYVFSTSCEDGCIYVASSGRGEFYMLKDLN